LEYKTEIHEQIFQIAFNSQGMLSFTEVYNMPIYLRKFYFKRLEKHYKEQEQEINKAQQKENPKPPQFKK
tara:strand:- start:30 stop:239 length:210 start_codon:yes stop_codon:yes gene_type:complete